MEDSCGRWLPHQVFRTPGQILAQAASLEEGQKLFTIARTSMAPLTQPAHYGTPIYAVALGCDLKFSKDWTSCKGARMSTYEEKVDRLKKQHD